MLNVNIRYFVKFRLGCCCLLVVVVVLVVVLVDAMHCAYNLVFRCLFYFYFYFFVYFVFLLLFSPPHPYDVRHIEWPDSVSSLANCRFNWRLWANYKSNLSTFCVHVDSVVWVCMRMWECGSDNTRICCSMLKFMLVSKWETKNWWRPKERR